MLVSEAIQFSVQALRAHPVRSLLTGIAMAIGTASVILVVSISLTGRDYILSEVEGIGSNLIFAYYSGLGPDSPTSDADGIKLSDLEAVRQEPSVAAATGVMTDVTQLRIDGKEQDIRLNSTDDLYPAVRNIVITSGRFLDQSDVLLRYKVAALTDHLAERMFGSRNAAVGQVIRLHDLQFTVIGTFREKVETFGQSEIDLDTIVIPITVQRYFTPQERIDPLYVRARSAAEVDRVALRVQRILEARHRPGATYRVETLTAIVAATKNISQALALVLFFVSAIALGISGVGIMNILLISVTERTREIGVRRAVGATPRHVLTQFLLEAVIVSVSGGIVGVVAGLAVPSAIRLYTGFPVRISLVAVWVALGVSCAVGLLFGTVPATRAARLNPSEALRYE